MHPPHEPLWSLKRYKSSELQHPAIFPIPSSIYKNTWHPSSSPSGPQSLTPKPWVWGIVRVGLPSSIPPIVPQKSYLGCTSCPPLKRSLPPLSARGTSGPQGGSSSSSPSHTSSLLSAEEAQVHVTKPRGRVDTVDTLMPKDPGQGVWIRNSACLAFSILGAIPEVGRDEDPFELSTLGSVLEEDSLPAHYGYAL